MPEPNVRFTVFREILKRYYGHRNPELLGAPRRDYSLHYTYRQDDQLYVASKVRRERGRVPFARQFVIMRTLEASGAGPVVRAPIDPGRRSERGWVGGPVNRWFVRSYTEHDRTPDWSSHDLIADAAQKLALVHHHARAIEPKVLKIPATTLGPYEWGLDDNFQRVNHLIRNMEKKKRNVRHIMAVHRGMNRLSVERRWLDLGPEGLTHHDLRQENMLVRDGRVVEIVDWDRAHWDVQWYDVTLAALHLANVEPQNLRWDLAETFMDAYRDESGVKLSPESIDWLLRYTAVRNLAVSRSPDKWARLLSGLQARRLGAPSFVDGFVAEDEVASDVDVAMEDGGAVEAAGVG